MARVFGIAKQLLTAEAAPNGIIKVLSSSAKAFINVKLNKTGQWA